ncbi:MAG: DNA replication and repair protein RecF [Microgenomates group bacterium]|jgi:DNA replication and repair protein RecF
MFLKNLKLTSFRNYSKLEIVFNQTTLLIGENAQGKSNFLEAIYFLATTKSPRAEKDIQLIKDGEVGCFVEGEVLETGPVTRQPHDLPTTLASAGPHHGATRLVPPVEDSTKLEIGMQLREEGNGLEKRVRVNGVPRRSVDYIGNLVVVHFSPEDINLVTGPPALRRWHIDLCLAQIDKLYKNSLTHYHEAVVSRNRILKRIKEGLARTDELTFWSKQVVDFGIVVSEKRRLFFQSLNDLKNESQFRFDYLESVLTAERLQEYLGREIAAANTLIGPHRDDFVFHNKGKNMAHFGSRGEQRTAVLDLKLAELQFIKQFKNTCPILLLDDVFSELDTNHREYIISAVSGQQTIISAVENEQIPAGFMKKVQKINVEKGSITF